MQLSLDSNLGSFDFICFSKCYENEEETEIAHDDRDMALFGFFAAIAKKPAQSSPRTSPARIMPWQSTRICGR